MNKTLLILALFFMSLSPSYASVYFSYITDVTKKGDTIYEFVMQYWNMERENEPNPCQAVLGSAGAKNCYLSINHYHAQPNIGGYASRSPWKCQTNFANFPSLNAIHNYALNNCGLSLPFAGSSAHAGSIKTDECVGFFLNTGPNKNSGRLLPGGICGIAPPPAGKCYFTNNGRADIVLDHGLLSPGEITGNKASGTFNIICNQSMRVKIISDMQQPYLNLRPNGEIISNVTINGSPAASGVTVSIIADRNTPITVESTLYTSTGTAEPGRFSGRTTLVMVIP